MSRLVTHFSIRLASIATFVFLLMALTVPWGAAASLNGPPGPTGAHTAATGPAAPGAGQAGVRATGMSPDAVDQTAPGSSVPGRPAAYTLFGDVSNTQGTAQTYFDTTYGTTTTCGWCFNTRSTATYAVALFGVAQGSASGIGVRGVGSYNGVQGFQGDFNVYPSSGFTSGGVYGQSTVSAGNGVVGVASNGTSAYGVWGQSTSGYGVVGGGGPTGVYGSGTSYGVQGSSAGTGVYGVSSGTTVNNVGVNGAGSGAAGRGVVGTSVGGIALLGASTSGSGFYGSSNNGPGGVLQSSTAVGVYAETYSASSYALVAGGLPNTYGNIYVAGHVYAIGGCCSTVETAAGNREMYAVESAQNTLSDHGTASLVNGRAVVSIDALFGQAANLGATYQVFLTPGSADTAGLAVINKTATSFEVRELNKGTGSFSFDWQVLAPRRGHESDRMEMAPAPPPPPPVAPDAFTLPEQAQPAQPVKK